MARRQTDPKQYEWLEKRRKQYGDAIDFERENRNSAVDDLKFLAGEQWPEKVRLDRQQAGRPCLTINRLPQFIRQVVNEVRLAPPSINVTPAEQGDLQTAEVMEGMIRSIEQASQAGRVYSQGLKHSASCGMGHWRIKTDYATEKTFDQDLFIESIPDPLAVVWDPASVERTRRDAKYCFVITELPKETFHQMYGKDTAEIGFYGDAGLDGVDYADWITLDMVRVAEYWEVSEETVELIALETGATIYAEDYEELAKAYQAALERAQMDAAMGVQPPEIPPPPGVRVDKNGEPMRRKVSRKKVRWWIMTGAEILSGPHEWLGDRIPIVFVSGEEVEIGPRVVRSSIIRFAKDSQRMINYWRSASVEKLALAPKAPFLVTDRQIEGREEEWYQMATGNPPFLTYTPDPQAGGPPQRMEPARIEGAMLQEAALASDDLKATTGIYDASLGARSNETSGRAILARQKEADVGTYAFIDGLLAAVEETGRILVDMIPKIYDTERQVRILGKKQEAAIIAVNAGPIDLKRGRYDVRVATGPSFTSQRAETAQGLLDMMQAAPMLAPIILPRIAELMDWPDAAEVAEEIRKLFQGQGQAPPPDPEKQAKARKTMVEANKIEFDLTERLMQLGLPLPGAAPTGAGPSPQGAPVGGMPA
jgi:hypothetical protein